MMLLNTLAEHQSHCQSRLVHAQPLENWLAKSLAHQTHVVPGGFRSLPGRAARAWFARAERALFDFLHGGKLRRFHRRDDFLRGIRQIIAADHRQAAFRKRGFAGGDVVSLQPDDQWDV